MKNLLCYILFTLLFCGLSLADDETDDEQKKEIIDSLVVNDGITVSEIEENGQKKYELKGTHGESLSADVVRIYNVVAVISQNASDKIFIMTDSANFNKKNREIVSDEYVEIIFEDGVITGIGMECEPNKNMFRILNNVKITLYTKSSDIGVKLPK